MIIARIIATHDVAANDRNTSNPLPINDNNKIMYIASMIKVPGT